MGKPNYFALRARTSYSINEAAFILADVSGFVPHANSRDTYEDRKFFSSECQRIRSFLNLLQEFFPGLGYPSESGSLYFREQEFISREALIQFSKDNGLYENALALHEGGNEVSRSDLQRRVDDLEGQLVQLKKNTVGEYIKILPPALNLSITAWEEIYNSQSLPPDLLNKKQKVIIAWLEKRIVWVKEGRRGRLAAAIDKVIRSEKDKKGFLK
jgi:hypothetical protein